MSTLSIEEEAKFVTPRGRVLRLLAAALVVTACGRVCRADLLNFECLSPTSVSTNSAGDVIHPGSLTQSIISTDERTVTIRRLNAQTFDVIDNGIQGPKAAPGDVNLPNGRWQDRALDPFSVFQTNPGARSDAFVFSFDAPVHIFSIVLGDYGGDVDKVRILGFTSDDGTGKAAVKVKGSIKPVASDPKAFTQKTFSFATTRDIRSIQVSAGAGGRDRMSVYLDRLFFYTSPLPEGEKLSDFLTDKNVFSENANDDCVVEPGEAIPTPPAFWGVLVLLPLALWRRRAITA